MIMEQDIQRAITSARAAIKSLQEGLPYADHGAYGQDRERIRKLRQELSSLKNKEQDDALASPMATTNQPLDCPGNGGPHV